MAIYLLVSKEKKRLPLWRMKRTKNVLYHKIEFDKHNNGTNGPSNGCATLDVELTTDEEKYDAVPIKNLRYRIGNTGFDEGYEMSTKLIKNNHTKSYDEDKKNKNESGFSIRSPKKYR